MQERGNRILRWLDRYVGIPLVLFLGCFKRKRKIQKTDEIAILITAGIGDTVLLTAILQGLRNKKVTLFTGLSNAEMAKLISDVTVIPLSILHPLASLKKIRENKFDIFIDANPWPRINAIFSFFARTNFSIGYQRKGQYRHYVYDHFVEHTNQRHEIENLRDLFSCLGICSIYLPYLEMKIKKRMTNLVALHPFAGGSRAYLKEWPEKKWIELINALNEQGLSVVLTGASKDQQRLELLKRSCKSPAMIEIGAGKLSLKETAHLLSHSTATISVDTGIMHLAAAVGCPVIALHGPTSPKRWGALGKKVISLQWGENYQPCIQLGFEGKCLSNHCMQGIEVSSVLSALSTFLKTS